jgi:hypothetical protein
MIPGAAGERGFRAHPRRTARITWYPARDRARAVALVGHGSVTGIEANPGAAGEASLDLAWTAVWPAAAGAVHRPRV